MAKPNAGLPYIQDGKTKFPMGSTEFGTYAAQFAEAGVNFMGGCCGTSPDHIKELATNMADQSPRPAYAPDYAALSSAREAVITRSGSPVRIIGERINPTGKKKLQAELKEGIFTTVQTFAREQKSTGAAVLDVNAGIGHGCRAPTPCSTGKHLSQERRYSPSSGMSSRCRRSWQSSSHPGLPRNGTDCAWTQAIGCALPAAVRQ